MHRVQAGAVIGNTFGHIFLSRENIFLYKYFMTFWKKVLQNYFDLLYDFDICPASNPGVCCISIWESFQSKRVALQFTGFHSHYDLLRPDT